MAKEPRAADLHKLVDVATKLEQAAEIVSRSQFATDHEIAEQLYREFWIIIDDLTALEKQSLIPLSHGWQTLPDDLREHVRVLTGFTNGVVTIANGPDQKRSQFFGPRGRFPLWSESPAAFSDPFAGTFDKVDERRRQNWKSLCRQIELLVAEERCRDAIEAIRVFVAAKTPDGDDEIPQTVTLDQMAGAVSRSKKTLERLKSKGKLPQPDVDGGGGKPDEWIWANVKPILELHYNRKLPDRFPSLRK